MKANILFRTILFVAIIPISFEYLFLTITEVDYEIDPKFGNVSASADNQTFFSPVTVWSYKKTSHFIVKRTVQSNDGKVLFNSTLKPCDRTMQQRLLNFVGQTFRLFPIMSDNKTGYQPLICPLPEGKIEFAAREKTKRLPVVIPSYYAKPGKMEMKYVIITKEDRKPVTLATITMRYEIEQIDE